MCMNVGKIVILCKIKLRKSKSNVSTKIMQKIKLKVKNNIK